MLIILAYWGFWTGLLSSVDGYMNIALENTEEYVDGVLKRSYGDAFVRGNNGKLNPSCKPYECSPGWQKFSSLHLGGLRLLTICFSLLSMAQVKVNIPCTAMALSLKRHFYFRLDSSIFVLNGIITTIIHLLSVAPQALLSSMQDTSVRARADLHSHSCQHPKPPWLHRTAALCPCGAVS